jgi:hypothetical protein
MHLYHEIFHWLSLAAGTRQYIQTTFSLSFKEKFDARIVLEDENNFWSYDELLQRFPEMQFVRFKNYRDYCRSWWRVKNDLIHFCRRLYHYQDYRDIQALDMYATMNASEADALIVTLLLGKDASQKEKFVIYPLTKYIYFLVFYPAVDGPHQSSLDQEIFPKKLLAMKKEAYIVAQALEKPIHEAFVLLEKKVMESMRTHCVWGENAAKIYGKL